jgi:hypothetical protein
VAWQSARRPWRSPPRSKSGWARSSAAYLASGLKSASPPQSGLAILSWEASLPRSYEEGQLLGRNPASAQPPAGPLYRGGRKITDFRGEPAAGDREPEEWVASTSACLSRRIRACSQLSTSVGRTAPRPEPKRST